MSWIVKNYEIHQRLGEGGMGTVYYAVDTQLHREVALKCLRSEVANNPGVMDRFRKEAQAQAQLNHPNIAQIWEFFQVGSEHYMAMEFINGPTLARVVREKGRLPYEEAGAYAIQALRGLDHAHKQGIVHRDIKPANLMIHRGGQVKVTDFGIARVHGASRDTRAGMIIGTYEYISPEAAQGLETTAVSDLYSMGVVLFEMITGRLPFESQSEYELLRMHIQAARPSVRATVRDVPGAIDDIVQRAMDRKAGRRFRSAEEMADGLQRCLDTGQKRTTPTGIMRFFSLGGETTRTNATPVPGVADRRRADVSSTCHRVEDLIEQHLFNDAGSVLEAGFRSYPDEPDFIDLRNRLQRQRQQYEQAIAQQTELIRDLLERGFSEEALKVAGNALTMYPRAGALLELQRECRRRVDLASVAAGEFAQVQGRVEELITAGQFLEATDYVLELLGAHENQIELNKLLARILQARKDAEKQAAIRQCMSEAEEAAEAGAWESALAILEGGLGRLPGEIKLLNLKQALNDRWQAEQRRRSVELAIAEARDLEIAVSLRAARERLTQDFDRLGRDPALVQELKRIDAAIEAARRDASIGKAVSAAADLQGERKWTEALDLLDRTTSREGRDTRIDELRATVAAELRAHEAQLAHAAADARQRIQNLEWEEAVLQLSTAVRELPGERVLNDLMQEAQRGLAQKRRDETIARIKSEAEERARALDYPAALRLLLDAVSQCPEDETLSAALSQTIFERDTYLAGEKAKAALNRASTLRGEARFEAAIEVVRGTLRELPGNPALQGALSELEREWREQRRRCAIAEITAVVEASLSAEDYQPALDRLAGGLAEWPGEPELLDIERETRASQRRTEQRKALLDTLEKGKVLEAEGHWDAAAQVFERTSAAFPETAAELQPRIAAARARALEERRKVRISELEREIGNAIAAGLLEAAETELQGAEREFPGEASVASWREVLAEERRRIAHAAVVRKANDQARRLLERQAFEEAQSVLLAAERECGPDAALRDVFNSVQAAQREHLAAIEAALARIQALVDKRDWDGAISVAALSTEKFPDEARFRALLGTARQGRELERRPKIDRRISQIDALLGEKAFDDAEVLIRNAQRDYGSEAALEKRKRQLEEGRHLEALEAAFRQTTSEVGRLCQQRQWEQSRQLVAPYLDDGKMQPAAEAILAELSRQEGAYRARTRELAEQARILIDDKRYPEALALLQPATAEFPEIGAFSRLLAEVRSGAAAEQEARRLGAAEQKIRSLMAEQRYEEALKAADGGLSEYPGEQVFRDLRALILAGIEEQAALVAVTEKVHRLGAAGKGTEADRVLVEALRRYPGRTELEQLRAAVDAARKAEWDRQSWEAGLKRAMSEIEKLLEQGQLADAGAAVAELENKHGPRTAPEVAQRVAAAVAKAERQRQAAEKRRAQALEAAFRQAMDDVGRLCQQRRWEQARSVVEEFESRYGAAELGAALRDRHVHARQARQQALDRLLAEAVSLTEADDLAGAIRVLEQPSLDADERPPFARLLEDARTSLRRQRAERSLDELKRDVSGALERGDVAAAMTLLDAGRTGLGLHETWRVLEIQVQHERDIACALKEASEDAAAHAWEAALRGLEDVTRDLGADPRLAELAGHIQQERDRHRELVEAVLTEARSFMESGNPDQAIQRLTVAIEAMPDEAQLSEALAEAQRCLSLEQRAARVRGVEARVRMLLSAGQPEEAEACIEESLRDLPGESSLLGLLTATRSARRLKAIGELTRVVEQTSAGHRWAAAESALRSFEQSHGADPLCAGLREKLAQAKTARQEILNAALIEASSLTKECNFAGAIELIQRLNPAPAERETFSVVLKQARAGLKQQRIDQSLRELRGRVSGAIGAGEIAAARAALAGARQEFDRCAAWRELDAQVHREEGIAEGLRRAAECAATRNWAEALGVAETLRRQFGEDARLTELAERIRREQEAHRVAVEKALAKARSLSESGQFEKAVERLTEVAEQAGGDPLLVAALAEARLASALEQRNARLRGIEFTARPLLSSGQFERAEVLLAEALRDLPRDSIVLGLLEEAGSGRRRNEEIGQSVSTVQALLNAGEPARAECVLLEALRKFPDAAPLLDLRGVVETARVRRRREKAIEAALSLGRQNLQECRFEDARRLLASMRQEHGEDARLDQLAFEIEASEQRKVEFDEVVMEVTEHLKAGRFQPALQRLEGFPKGELSDARIRGLSAECRRLAAQQTAELDRMTARVESLMQKGLSDDALILLEGASREQHIQERLQPLMDRARELRESARQAAEARLALTAAIPEAAPDLPAEPPSSGTGGPDQAALQSQSEQAWGMPVEVASAAAEGESGTAAEAAPGAAVAPVSQRREPAETSLSPELAWPRQSERPASAGPRIVWDLHETPEAAYSNLSEQIAALAGREPEATAEPSGQLPPTGNGYADRGAGTASEMKDGPTSRWPGVVRELGASGYRRLAVWMRRWRHR